MSFFFSFVMLFKGEDKKKKKKKEVTAACSKMLQFCFQKQSPPLTKENPHIYNYKTELCWGKTKKYEKKKYIILLLLQKDFFLILSLVQLKVCVVLL